jgi:cobalt-precorrin-5B (C1)-methyltransferase
MPAPQNTEHQQPPEQRKKLRSGYSTGACAAAAAKAAVLCLLGQNDPGEVDIPFPDGARHSFLLCRYKATRDGAGTVMTSAITAALASVVKDAGDDPDVTNGAEIGAEVRWCAGQGTEQGRAENITLTNGPGVGLVTKPGLPVAVGEPAINPVPRQMIRAAVREALAGSDRENAALHVSIFVRDGESLATKTLNRRLGILGGLSILGTTGIVRPVSARAWTETIETSMSVARALGLNEVILSTGRTSEAAVQQQLCLPEESQVMMGDYLHYALAAAQRHGFTRIHLAGMWAKLVKAALAVPQTHVRNGALETRQAADLLLEFGVDLAQAELFRHANTAREIYQQLKQDGRDDLITAVCGRAKAQAEAWSGLPVRVYLVTSEEGLVYGTD